MSLEINPECVGCGERRCSNCAGEKVPLYPNPPKSKRGMDDEALHGDYYGSKPLHGCKPHRAHAAAIINRAAPLPARSTVEARPHLMQLSYTGTLASNPELAYVAHPAQDKTNPIGAPRQDVQDVSGLELETYAGECTPRSIEEDEITERDLFGLAALDVVPDTDEDHSSDHSSAFSWPQFGLGNIEVYGSNPFDPDGNDLLDGLDLDLAFGLDFVRLTG
ncbi:hypothetical protein F4814DRAFT_423881 [Daldinia grandis]|nr:hypothetical protein F4814DRAFT_423881 [Daldinia grandis]